MQRFIYFILLISVLVSCVKEVHIPIEYTQPKLVVNGLFNTDSLWDIEVSASKYIYDTAAIPLINDAQVIITNSAGNSILLINQGNGIYASLTERPEIGEVYSIEVSHSDYDDVSSSNQLPGEINIAHIDWDQQAIVAGDFYRRIDISFQDGPDKDFYMVRVKGIFWEYIYNEETWEIEDSALIMYPIEFFSQNAAFDNSSSKITPTSISFTDEIFNGSLFTFDILIDDDYFSDEEDEKMKIQSIYISMSKISQEYYWYETSYQAYLSAQYNMFAQPVQVYTNIENGLGIFAGYSTTIDSLIIE